jgi:hypothetical protein
LTKRPLEGWRFSTFDFRFSNGAHWSCVELFNRQSANDNRQFSSRCLSPVVFPRRRPQDARYEIHGAFTRLDLDRLRSTGMIRLGLAVLIVDAQAGVEVGRGEVTREYRLLDVAPDEGGALGQSRFVERRIKAFIEALALDALNDAGLD